MVETFRIFPREKKMSNLVPNTNPIATKDTTDLAALTFLDRMCESLNQLGVKIP